MKLKNNTQTRIYSETNSKHIASTTKTKAKPKTVTKPNQFPVKIRSDNKQGAFEAWQGRGHASLP